MGPVHSMEQVIIVGASLAGLQAAQTLRRAEFDGAITMVGDEPHYPYDRPPLSKQYLAGDWDEEKLRLRGAADPEALGVDWRLGARATGLDVDQATVTVDGESLPFDGLVIATGASPRVLPGIELDGVFALRGLDDARGLRAAFDAGPTRVVVIGAGFIGAEVASTARGRGLDVTMIEAASAPLMRVLDAASGMAVADLHRANGVDVRLGAGVASIDGADGRVQSVVLDDGSVIEADVVVIGIGVTPNTAWLEDAALIDSSLEIDNGVVCDASCAAAPGIVAVGDVARWPNQRFGGALTRVEQWDNAIDQGAHGARTLLSWSKGEASTPFAPVPWFWSDQYDRKIQLAGVSGPNVELVQGSLEEQRFVQLYLDDTEAVVGALAWNRPRQAIQSRQLLAAEAPIDEFRSALA